jgi:hypothetical protein
MLPLVFTGANDPAIPTCGRRGEPVVVPVFASVFGSTEPPPGLKHRRWALAHLSRLESSISKGP